MAGEEAPFKRAKLSGNRENVFFSFHKDHLRSLELALSLMDHEQAGYGVGISKIKVCNAQCSKRFSRATCDCEEYSTPCSSAGSTSEPVGFRLSGIFQHGFDMLESYVESPGCIPQRKGARIALEKLLTFLSDKGSAEKALAPDNVPESEWTTRVAHHLLSKLAVGADYTIDNQCEWMSKDLRCKCGCGEQLSGQYGDTSLGVPSYWYGRVDVLMDVAVATFVTEKPDTEDDEERSFFEMKSTSDIMAACREQIRAKSIVFSFLQKKKHPDLDNFLIPTIAMSKTQVAICLYDSENDIFLETPRLDLFHEGRYLKIATVVTLWLALNFRYCCSGVPEEIIETNFKADFFAHVWGLLEKYSDDVKSPCDYKPTISWLALPYNRRLKRKESTNSYQKSSPPNVLTLNARTVRVGTLRGSPVEPILISNKGLNFHIEGATGTRTFHIYPPEILQCMTRFVGDTNLIFFLTSQNCALRIRQDLGMDLHANPTKPPPEYYYDPTGTDDRHQLIILVMDQLPLETRHNFKKCMKLFKSWGRQGDDAFFIELDKEEADQIFRISAGVCGVQQDMAKSVKVINYGHNQAEEDQQSTCNISTCPKICFVDPIFK